MSMIALGEHPARTPPTPLADRVGREVRYLRLSVTPACPMRCIYCRPAAEVHTPSFHLLSRQEIGEIVTHLVRRHGLRKVRLTGGEPTSRPDLLAIVQTLSADAGVTELAMTTNGLRLANMAEGLKAAGLDRVNVSIDSLDRRRFEQMTGIDGLTRVIHGIDAAVAAGLGPVKLNTVVVRGHNDDELDGLVAFAAERDLEIRFIELMPMGPLKDRWRERFVSEQEMRKRLARIVAAWVPIPWRGGAARCYRAQLFDGRVASVGFISAMSCPFCERCDRIRITANGDWYPCLMDRPAGSLLPALRPVFNPGGLDDLLRRGMPLKQDRHPGSGVVTMTVMGG